MQKKLRGKEREGKVQTVQKYATERERRKRRRERDSLFFRVKKIKKERTSLRLNWVTFPSFI